MLVGRKISAYYRYIEAHPKLGDCKNAAECYSVARQLVDDYVENREITRELEHYKKHKTLLKDNDIIQDKNS